MLVAHAALCCTFTLPFAAEDLAAIGAAATVHPFFRSAQNRRTDDPDEPDRSASFSIQRLSPGPRPAQPQAPKALQPQPPAAPETSFLDRLLESVLKGSASELARMQVSLELCVLALTLACGAQMHAVHALCPRRAC